METEEISRDPGDVIAKNLAKRIVRKIPQPVEILEEHLKQVTKNIVIELPIVHGLTILASADLMAVNLAKRLKIIQIFAGRTRRNADQDSPADLKVPRNERTLRNSVERTPKNVEAQASQLVFIQHQQAAFRPKAAIIRHPKKDIQQIL